MLPAERAVRAPQKSIVVPVGKTNSNAEGGSNASGSRTVTSASRVTGAADGLDQADDYPGVAIDPDLQGVIGAVAW